MANHVLLALCAAAAAAWVRADTVKYIDDFATSASLANYTVAGGTWSVQAGQLHGYYPITIGGTTDPQGDLLLLPQFQPQTSDWKYSFDFNYQLAESGYSAYQAWASLIIWFSSTEKYEIFVGDGGNNWDGAARTDISLRAESFPWNEYVTETLPLNWNPRAQNHVQFAKVGNDVRVTVNGTYLASVPVPFGGRQATLGFHVYGSVLFDNLEVDEVTDGTTDLCSAELAALQSQVDQLTAELKTCNDTDTALQAQIGSLTAQLATAQQTIASLQAQNATLITSNQSLHDQLSQANAQIAQLTTNLQAAQAANQTLQNQVSALQTQVATDQTTIANLNGQIASLTATNQSLQSQLAQANSQISSLQTQLAAANNQISTLQSNLSAATAQISNLTAQNAQLSSANQSLQTQLTQANAQIAQLTSDLQASQAANQSLQAQLGAANSQIASLTAQNAQLSSTNQALSTQNSAMISQIQALNQFFATLFNNPTFQLPGSTPQQQLQNLVNAVQQLNHGQQQALYKNLGG